MKKNKKEQKVQKNQDVKKENFSQNNYIEKIIPQPQKASSNSKDISDEALKVLIFEFYELLLKRVNVYKFKGKDFYLLKFVQNYKNSRFLNKNMKPDFLHEFIKPFNFYEILLEKLKDTNSPDAKISLFQGYIDDINDITNLNFIKLIFRLSPNDRMLDSKYYSPFFDYLYKVCEILLEINLNIKEFPDADYLNYPTQVKDYFFPIITNTKDRIPELISKQSSDERILSIDELEQMYVDDKVEDNIEDIYKSIKRSFA